MHTSDHSNFYKLICDLPNQINKTPSLLSQIDFKKFDTKYSNIILTGMGGSAIAGELLKEYLTSELKIPFTVNRNYILPNYVGPESLVLACSYSGNTEETIAATKLALEKKATVIGLSSGGSIEKLLKQKNITFIKIPSGYPPRQALGYIFFPFLHFFQHIGLISPKHKDIKETVKVLEELRKRNDPTKSQTHNLCNLIAQKLYKRIPIIYTASEILYPVTVRWRNQINENSKVLAFSNVFPELSHNEIMGWEAPKDILKIFNILFLRDQSETPRNKKRLEITKEIFHKNQLPIFEIFGEGQSLLARMFSHIYIGDWISYYLALLYEKDPLQINSIQFLKDELSKHK